MTPELLKSEADNCDAQSGLSPAPLLGCWWKFDESTWSYDTKCDNKFQFTNDGPIENGFRFCPYCGGEISLLPDEKTCIECEIIGKPNCPEHGGKQS